MQSNNKAAYTFTPYPCDTERIFANMLAALKQLHPLPDRKSVFVVALLMGVVIGLFLIVLQPFGLESVPAGTRKTLILWGYGAITFAVVAYNGTVQPRLLPSLYSARRWTLGKDLFLLGFLNFAEVALVNFIYSSWAFHFPFSWGSLVFSMVATLSVGFLPFVILVLYRHNRLLQQNLGAATSINAHLPATEKPATGTTAAKTAAKNDQTTLVPDGGGEALVFSPGELLYVESADNYIKVILTQNGTAKTTIVRQTLKHFEELTRHYPSLVRCHRSFLVNLEKVTNAEGNAQGLRLHLEHCTTLVPVSRSYVQAVKALLNAP